MTQYKNFVDSIKEFSFDVLGFLIPGFCFTSILLMALDPNLLKDIDTSHLPTNLFEWFFIIISYLFGYVGQGLSLLGIKLCGNSSWQERAEKQIEKKSLFKDALAKYKDMESNIKQDTDYTLRQLRTRIMSFIPEADQKIYSFRFRSDLCEHSSKLFYLYLIIIILSLIIQECFDINILNDSLIYIIGYFTVLFLAILLTIVRNRYYGITMKVPLSIFLSKKIIDA